MPPRINPMPAMPLLAEPPEWNAAPEPAPPRAVGQSVLGNAINLYGARRANLLVIGGVHGDESEGIFLAHLLLAAGCAAPLIPCLNPDGALLRQRWNRRNVDLNRNLPTPDWSAEATNPRYPPGAAPASEPETQAFLAALEAVQPSTILSLHSYKETFIEIERPERELSAGLNAAVLDYAAAAGIERRQSIGYPTPGALGAFGRAKALLVLTYELERGRSHGELEALLQPLRALIARLDGERFAAP
jgi:predicted deacylase